MVRVGVIKDWDSKWYAEADFADNFEMYDQIAKSSSIQFVVSGGIKDFDNIKKVAEKGYYACIVGKAYYEKKIDLKETIQCLQNV